MSPAELRAVVFELSGGRCEWPQCARPAKQCAHIVSRGMGGGSSRNDPSNAFAACDDHALVSDGLPPVGGGLRELRAELAKLPGYGPTYPGRNAGKSRSMDTRDWHPLLRRWLILSRDGLG